MNKRSTSSHERTPGPRPEWLPSDWVFLPDAVERYGAHRYGDDWTGREAGAFSRWLIDPEGVTDDDEVAAGYRWRDAVNVLREHLYSRTLSAHVFSDGKPKLIQDPARFGENRAAWIMLLAGVSFTYKEELAHPAPGANPGPGMIQEAAFWQAVSLETTPAMIEVNAWVVVPAEELATLLGEASQDSDREASPTLADGVPPRLRPEARENWKKLGPRTQAKYHEWFEKSEAIKAGKTKDEIAGLIEQEYYDGLKPKKGYTRETIYRQLDKFFIWGN